MNEKIITILKTALELRNLAKDIEFAREAMRETRELFKAGCLYIQMHRHKGG